MMIDNTEAKIGLSRKNLAMSLLPYF
jgi:hypothetical protein